MIIELLGVLEQALVVFSVCVIGFNISPFFERAIGSLLP